MPVLKARLVVCVASILVMACRCEESLNNKVVAFCEEHLNKQVDNGECAMLAVEALKHAHAKPMHGNNPNNGDYDWGKEVFYLYHTDKGLKSTGKAEDIKPGDIIQFRDAKFKEKRTVIIAAHHTAIVSKVDGRDLKTFEQNSNGKKYVQQHSLHLDDLKEGWIRIYEPEPQKAK